MASATAWNFAIDSSTRARFFWTIRRLAKTGTIGATPTRIPADGAQRKFNLTGYWLCNFRAKIASSFPTSSGSQASRAVTSA
jgi:hypothetical protein